MARWRDAEETGEAAEEKLIDGVPKSMCTGVGVNSHTCV